jgi:hypothetical protein
VSLEPVFMVVIVWVTKPVIAEDDHMSVNFFSTLIWFILKHKLKIKSFRVMQM